MMRQTITAIVEAIEPLDELEAVHKQDVLAWISSGADLYRVKKPDVPPKHLVSYFAIIDPETNNMLLQHHLLANRWLPSGGHVDSSEDPAETVRRECLEELGIQAVFLARPTAQFVTITEVTDGDKKHVDVSLWYLLQAKESAKLTIEPDRFAAIKWWNIEEIQATSIALFDPHMHRFVKKLASVIPKLY